MTATVTQTQSVAQSHPPVASTPGDFDSSIWYSRDNPYILHELGFRSSQIDAGGAPILRVNGADPKIIGSKPDHNKSLDAFEKSKIAQLIANVNLCQGGQLAPNNPRLQKNSAIYSMQKQAAKTRNQFALKYFAVKLFEDLGPGAYNPLQTIRDRKANNIQSACPAARRDFMWEVSPSELGHDLSWRRGGNDKSKSQSPEAPEGLAALNSDSLMPSPHGTSGHITTHSTKSSLSFVSDFTDIDPHTSSFDYPSFSLTPVQSNISTFPGKSPSSTVHALNSPNCYSPEKAESQLIHRLKCKYDPTPGNTDDEKTELLLPGRPQQCKPLMSRNSSSLYIKQQHARSASEILPETYKRLSAATTSSALPHGTHSTTSVIGKVRSSTNIPSLIISSPGERSSSSSEETSPTDLEGFTSLMRTKTIEDRKREDTLAQHEVEYMIAVFEAALRKKNSKGPTKLEDLPCRGLVCSAYKENFKAEVVPKYLDYLSQMERNALTKQDEITAELGQPIDTLRVNSDRIISEVNTILNKKLRETSSRLDKIETAGRTACLYNYGYVILHWAVVFVLRLIWFVVGGFSLCKKATFLLLALVAAIGCA